MERPKTVTEGMWLTCAAFALALGGCTSDGASTGGIEATLSLDAGATTKQIDTVTVTVSCDGTDPITGLPWPSETFDVDVSTSEGNNPLDPKNTLGVFKKEGLPAGNCTVTLTAVSDDGAMQCGGQMTNISVVAGRDNTFVTIVVNCITDARYGSIGVNGEFNQCLEYSQIIASPTTQSAGSDVNVDIWCYDPDGDQTGLAAILFVTAASVGANPTNPSAWVDCGTAVGPTVLPCPSADPPTVPANQSVDTTVTCNLSNEACLVIVSVSDDGFASAQTDPFGCSGQDDNANAVIPVFCQGFAVCGDGVVEGVEECDPPGDPNASNEFCNSSCKLYDPCANPTQPPASCAPASGECQVATCSESGGTITCGEDIAANNTPCSIGTCQSGVCQACSTNAQCDDSSSCTTDVCDMTGATNVCVNTPLAVGSVCDTTGQCTSSGQCANGDCTNSADSTYVCSPAGAGIKGTLTACGVCASLGLGCPTLCDGSTSPAFGDATLCAQNTLLLGGNGGACMAGLSGACLTCYATVAACGTASCATECAAAPAGCTCLDCVNTACDADFEACAGYGSGSDTVLGGPPACESFQTCTP